MGRSGNKASLWYVWEWGKLVGSSGNKASLWAGLGTTLYSLQVGLGMRPEEGVSNERRWTDLCNAAHLEFLNSPLVLLVLLLFLCSNCASLCFVTKLGPNLRRSVGTRATNSDTY